MSVSFSKAAEVFAQLESVTSGNRMREILSDFFRKIPAEDIDKISYMLPGKIDADYRHVETGLAEKMVLRAEPHGLSAE